MAALDPLFVGKDSSGRGVSPRDGRIALGGLLTAQGPGALDIRTGVLSGYDVTGTSDTGPMTLSISAGHDVAMRSAADGPELGSNDGPTKVNVATAPASNARIDLVWKRNTDEERDGSTEPLFGVTEGAVSATPTGDYASLPAGALVLYEARIGAGAVRTTDPQVTLTRVAKRTVARGGILPVANQAERDALTAYEGLYVDRADKDWAERYDGTTWKPQQPTINAGTSGVLAGVAPPAGTPLIRKTWTGAITTDGSGQATITFPGGAFPNGLVAVQHGLAHNGVQSGFWTQTVLHTLSALDLRVVGISGGVAAFIPSATVRVSVSLDGW